jgi:hypothetical protein
MLFSGLCACKLKGVMRTKNPHRQDGFSRFVGYIFPIELSQRKILAVGVGILIIFTSTAIINTLSFVFYSYLARSLNPQSFRLSLNQAPLITVKWLFRITSWAFLIIAGAVVGWKTEEKGWLYGALSEIILLVISIGVFLMITLILPNPELIGPIKLETRTIILQSLFSLWDNSISIILVSLGGWLGENLHKRQNK